MSVFDIFKIGIGPSSSHTVGPMRAALLFLEQLVEEKVFTKIAKIQVELYGSLAFTGMGHGTDKALMLGFLGERPDTLNPDDMEGLIKGVVDSSEINLLGKKRIPFAPKEDLQFVRKKTLPFHSNGMQFTALDAKGKEVSKKIYYSVGGGFVVSEEGAKKDRLKKEGPAVRYKFSTAAELLKLCESEKITISQLMLANEEAFRPEAETRAKLRKVWEAMEQCIDRGCRSPGVLPGKLKVKRRAPDLLRSLEKNTEAQLLDPLNVLDWVNLYALAVNEENACGARVVTAPTNGAAGIIPAVGRYFLRFIPGANEEKIFDYLLTSGAIAILYAENASISGAEVGCQGEVGVACSMAAGGLAAALGGTIFQVEQAAEIGMEHNLGLTCDPIGGLVQIPCIERNAMGSVKAINAARIAMRSDGKHFVSLDNVIKTMRQTGMDMKTKYKETSRGGLAVNVIEC